MSVFVCGRLSEPRLMLTIVMVIFFFFVFIFIFFQAEDGIRDLVRSRGLGDVYKRQMYVGTRAAVTECVALMVIREVGAHLACGLSLVLARAAQLPCRPTVLTASPSLARLLSHTRYVSALSLIHI